MPGIEIIEQPNPIVITVEVPGPPGSPNVLTIGTIESVDYTETATATITGFTPNQVLSLSIPRGEPGVAGASGDHHLLTNLDLDDHPQYHNNTRGDARYSLLAHTHDTRYYTETEVDTFLAGKSDTTHTHDSRYYTETEMDAFLVGKSDVSHIHDDRYYTETETDTLLAGKANSSHTHVATTDLTATGTKNSTTFLRGDNTWAVPPATADATTTTKGIVQLAGDLAGTAAAPTVPGLANKADKTTTISAGSGLTGGGDLSANRTLSVSFGSSSGTVSEGNHTHNYIPSFTDPDADRIVFWDDSAGAYAALTPTTPLTITTTSISIDAATTTASGIVELATSAETTTGTDTVRATTPAGVKAVADTKANTSTTISAGTGLTGGGDLSANRTLTVSYGSASGTSVQGNDARVTADQAAGTASIRTIGTGALQAAAGNHTHTSKDVTNPSVALTDGATINTDASLGRLFRVTVAGNRTFAAPTNASDGARIMYEITASAADRTVTFTTGSSGAFAFGTDFTSIPVITSGTTTFVGAVYSTRSSRWHLLAVGGGHS